MLLVYSPNINNRLEYIVRTIVRSEVVFTSDVNEFIQYEGAKINYSPDVIGQEALHITPHGLLNETGFRQQKTECFDWNGYKAFFKTNGDIPFDIFSASFYLITRYEEYLPHKLDIYERYAHTNSLAFKEGFLKLPLVNLWMMKLEEILLQKFPSFQFQSATFSFLPTYDIDIAYSYKGKGRLKNTAGIILSFLSGETALVKERIAVLKGRIKDPFDTFDWIDALHEAYKLQPAYFLLTIISRGRYDKNLPACSPELQELYRRLSLKYTVGLHPSWQSNFTDNLLGKEINTLQNIIAKPVTISRNHYLKFTLPYSYRKLIDSGITDDYSMAYSTINGFRASYTNEHRWYDIEKEQTTSLKVHPFSYMEANSYFEQHYIAGQAALEIQYYHDVVKKVNGTFIVLFHNHFLAEQKQWLPWRKMYADFLQKNFG